MTENYLRVLSAGHEPNIDIIAVHGLNPKNKYNHAERTWETDGKLWLRDFLPKKLPRARILLFGYNSNVGIQSSSAGVREQAQNLLSRIWLERQDCEQRPILFIAHSLGGIVIKEALVQAKLGAAYNTICVATCGIAFFGTPHQGSPLANIGDVFAKVVRTALGNPSNTFMNALKKNDLYARELSSNFQQLLENYRFLNFYETLPLKNIGLIVEKRSATLGLPDSREVIVALNANHESMCRFACEDDDEYKHVSSLIVELANSATDLADQYSFSNSFSGSDSSLVDNAPDPRFFMIPYSRNSGFVDREPVFHQLKDCIEPVGKFHSRVALYGLGGVGKSQVAIEFAYRFHAEYPEAYVFWVHANSIERFREGYFNIFDECHVSGTAENDDSKLMLVKEWLEGQHKKWLLIVDNADEVSLFTTMGSTTKSKSKLAGQYQKESSVLEYLPDCPHGSILITTRDRAAGVKFTRSHSQNLVEVGTMTNEEAESLIKSTVTDDCLEEAEMIELANLLNRLPLAIVQATAFMQENTLTVGEYMELYNDSDETRMDLLCEPFEALGRDTDVPNALATTLMVSINHIKERDAKAIDILSLIAFLDQHHIPKSLLQQKVKKPLDFTKALGTLKAFSLVMASRDGKHFSIHRLVQLVIRKWLLTEASFEDQAIQAMDILAGSYPDANFENWAICGAYLPHAQSVLQFTPDLSGTLLRRRLYLQEGIAYYLWSQGRNSEAEELDLLIVEENKREFGMKHPETLEGIGGLASTYESQGRYEEAEKLDLILVETRKKLLGGSDPLTLTSMLNLGHVYKQQHRYQEAEKLFLEIFETARSNLGEEHEMTIDAMAGLGSVYLKYEKLEQAEEMILHVWNSRCKEFGPNHTYTTSCAQTLALVYQSRGKLQEAKELAIENLRSFEEYAGPRHPGTRQRRDVLISIYESLEDWHQAGELTLHALNEASEMLGPTHMETLETKHNLSTIYLSAGLQKDAERIEDELIRDCVQGLGPDGAFTLKYKALVCKRRSMDMEATQLMVQAVNKEERMLGPFHDETLASLGFLTEWCGKDEAIEMLLDAEQKERGFFYSPDSPVVVNSLL